MAINQTILDAIDAEADTFGPDVPIDADAFAVDESPNLDDKIGLKPISIRFPVPLLEDLKAMALINRMGYQPLIREICKRFVDAEKRAFARDLAVRRREELQAQRKMVEETQHAIEAAEEAIRVEQDRTLQAAA